MVNDNSFFKTRFQAQPWYVKLWRLRFYLYAPFWACYSWFYSWQDSKRCNPPYKSASFSMCWDIAIGMAEVSMKRLWTAEEAGLRLHKLDNHLDELHSECGNCNDCSCNSPNPVKKKPRKKNARSTKRK